MAGGTRPPTPSRYIRRGAGVPQIVLTSYAANRSVRVRGTKAPPTSTNPLLADRWRLADKHSPTRHLFGAVHELSASGQN